MEYAPVILFVYNRPEHTRKTLESLMNNDLSSVSELFIFSDGAKENSTEELLNKVNTTKTIIREKQWCKKVTIAESDVNKGLSLSIIEGVSKIINEYGKAIVLEDDMVTSPYFLRFMNDALNVYESHENVACISGYIYPVKKKLPETFFIKGADCWGWGTWKNAWDLFEKDGTKLLRELESRSLTEQFDFDGAYPYTQMLRDQINGKNNSWAIRWYACAFLNNHYCLYPGNSLVQNIGIDGSGSHNGISNKWVVDLWPHQINVKQIPIEENLIAKNNIAEYFQGLKEQNSIFKRLLNKLNAFIKR